MPYCSQNATIKNHIVTCKVVFAAPLTTDRDDTKSKLIRKEFTALIPALFACMTMWIHYPPPFLIAKNPPPLIHCLTGFTKIFI